MLIVLSQIPFFLVAFHYIVVYVRDNFKQKIEGTIALFFNWRFAFCFILSWAIIHVPIYLGIILGLKLGIKWLYSISLSIYGFLWLPFCNESVIQIFMALWMQKRFFPKHTEVKDMLNQFNDKGINSEN